MTEYIIINKTAIQERIEDLKMPRAHYDGIYVSDANIAEYEALEEILSQSTPLIPEIEKAIKQGIKLGKTNSVIEQFERKQDYISNLKLDI